MDWLYIHFPHLYGETWLANFHDDKPIALVNNRANQQSIDDVNTAAQARGIEVDMALNTAFCLCPQLQVITQAPHKQKCALERVALIASRYSAWIGLDEPNGLYLEIASMKKLFGEAKWMQRRLQKQLQQQGYSAVIAAAPHAKAAHLLAKAKCNYCYNQQQLLNSFANIPINALDISPKVEVNLMKLGLRNVHDLMQLPSSDLSYRVDAELALYLDQVVGRKSWLPEPLKLPERFRWAMDLEQEFESLEPLRFFLAKGIQLFCDFLQKRSLASQELCLVLQHRQQAPSIIDIKLASLDNRIESWQYMLTAMINRIELKAPVVGLGLIASLFETLSKQDLYLFKHISQEYDLKKTQLLNRLGARLNIDSIKFLQTTSDPRPERQTVFTSQPITESLPAIETFNTPLCLSTQPQAIKQDQFCLHRGPLRLATGWWDRATAHRDYYAASDKRVSSQWLFLDASGQWYRHGWFV